MFPICKWYKTCNVLHIPNVSWFHIDFIWNRLPWNFVMNVLFHSFLKNLLVGGSKNPEVSSFVVNVSHSFSFRRQLTCVSVLFVQQCLWWQNEVKIDSLHLGSTPPVFNFIRALEHPPEGDHLVSFLLQLAWCHSALYSTAVDSIHCYRCPRTYGIRCMPADCFFLGSGLDTTGEAWVCW